MNIFPRRNTHLTYVFSVLLSLMLFTALKIMKDIFCKYTTSFSWCICLISPFKMIHCVMFNLSLHVKRERKIRKIYGQNIYPNFSFVYYLQYFLITFLLQSFGLSYLKIEDIYTYRLI